MFEASPTCLLANAKRVCLFFSLSNGFFFLALLPYSPALWSVWLQVALWTDTPISAGDLCSSFRVIFGLFIASLINALLAWSVSFCGWSSLVRFVVVPYSLKKKYIYIYNGFNGSLWDVQRF